MSHIVWIEHGFNDLAHEVAAVLRPHEIEATTERPIAAPDLMVLDWDARDAQAAAPGRVGADWAQAPPPAQLYLASAEHIDVLIAQPFADPLTDVLLLPVRAADLALAIARSLARRNQYLNLRAGPGFGRVDAGEDGGLVGSSPVLRKAIALARQVAASPATSVLIQGESGTGKDLLARLIHTSTPTRRHRPFIDLNCAAIPSDLLEAELFGFERGAFTNAARDKAGLMELAHGGTLFLDEIGELNVGLQAKLLRVLEGGTFRRLGGVTERRSDCRVVASTNRNLLDAVQQGLFRLDLYHRLAVLTIHTPPVRERREDIMPMAQQFLEQFSTAMKKPATGFSPTAQALLMGYPYPGNVRELRNIVERALIVTPGPWITPKDLGLELALMADTTPAPAASTQQPPRVTGFASPLAPPMASALALPQQSPVPVAPHASSARLETWHPPGTLAEKEREHIEQVLVAARGNRALAARLLRISTPTLYKKMRKYGLEAVGR